MIISAPEPLQAYHHLDDFDCDKESLNIWLKPRATHNQQRGFTVVMVVHANDRVIGYYGLAPTAVI